MHCIPVSRPKLNDVDYRKFSSILLKLNPIKPDLVDPASCGGCVLLVIDESIRGCLKSY